MLRLRRTDSTGVVRAVDNAAWVDVRGGCVDFAKRTVFARAHAAEDGGEGPRMTVVDVYATPHYLNQFSGDRSDSMVTVSEIPAADFAEAVGTFGPVRVAKTSKPHHEFIKAGRNCKRSCKARPCHVNKQSILQASTVSRRFLMWHGRVFAAF